MGKCIVVAATGVSARHTWVEPRRLPNDPPPSLNPLQRYPQLHILTGFFLNRSGGPHNPPTTRPPSGNWDGGRLVQIQLRDSFQGISWSEPIMVVWLMLALLAYHTSHI